MTNQPTAAPSKGQVSPVIIILLVILAICILVPCCIIAVLYLLGPAVGNVFSDIITNMITPMP